VLDSASLPHTLTRHGPRAGTDCGPVCVTYGYYCYNLSCYCIQPSTTSGPSHGRHMLTEKLSCA